MRLSRCRLQPGGELGGPGRLAWKRCSSPGLLRKRPRTVQKHERAFSCCREGSLVTFHSHCGEESTGLWKGDAEQSRVAQPTPPLWSRLSSGSAPASLHTRRGRADAIDQLSPVSHPRGGDQHFRVYAWFSIGGKHTAPSVLRKIRRSCGEASATRLCWGT